MTTKPPTGRPSFFSSIDALRLDARPDHSHVRPTDDELDAADALELIHAHHYSDAEHPDRNGSWGPCVGCSDQWPCKAWLWGQQLSLQWLGRAHARYTSRVTGAPTPTLDPSTPMPSQRSSIEIVSLTERRRLERLRGEPATPVYCRHPDCRTVLSIPHPLQPGYLHDALCAAHQDSIADRYPHGWGFCATPNPDTGRLCLRVTCDGAHKDEDRATWTTRESA